METTNSNPEIASCEAKDSQDTYCEIVSPMKSQTGETIKPCSQQLFSEEFNAESNKIEPNKINEESQEVQVVLQPSNIIVLTSDTDDKSSNTHSDNSTTTNATTLNDIKSDKMDCEISTTDISNTELIDACKSTPDIFKCELTPVKMPCRSSPRLTAKRRNSFSFDNQNAVPARRLKRCLSADIEINQKINVDTEAFSRLHAKLNSIESADNDNVKSPTPKETSSVIEEEVDTLPLSDSATQNLTNDSQNLILEFCPTQSSNNGISDSEIKNINNNNKEESKNNEHVDSTSSINLDSPLNNNLENIPSLKTKPYLSNGYTSSTPEMVPFNPALFKTKILSDDSDSTPPFYNKPVMFSKMSKTDLIGIRSNTSISPISNGQSDGSYVANTTNQSPTFDVQIHCDDKNEFLSLLIVKTDNDLGFNISKEYQKITKNMNIDHYFGDVSKSNSPSSVTSGGLLPLQPRTSFMSSSSSSSSTRTHDGTFVIPQKPSKAFSFQNCITLKGLNALKQKVDDVISHLMEMYPDDSAQSISHVGDKISANSSYENDKKTNGVQVSSATPKSSKKKLQTKKRTFNKAKKVLPTTSEEINIDGEIHSPEMVGTDLGKCKRPSTPLRNPKLNDVNENNNLMKSPTKSNGKKNDCIQSPKQELAPYCPGTMVLARWTDKKYYFGYVKESVDLNTYVIKFYDNNEKKISEDFILFGNLRELPILGQSVHAVVDEHQNYEPSLVLNLVDNTDGTVSYRCTTDRDLTVEVKASDIFVTEDQAKSIRECCMPQYGPSTPRSRKLTTEVDLDNIIHGPRSTRLKNKKDFLSSPSSPKASTSDILTGLSQKKRPRKMSVQPKQRHESESSEGGESIATRAPSSLALEEVIGVQPEIQKTPRKISGVTVAGPTMIKGVSKQNIGKRCSKITKFENDTYTNNQIGPIPPEGSELFKDYHFILTCTDPPQKKLKIDQMSYSSENDYHNASSSNTENEDYSFTATPFHKDRLKEQLEAGGGVVYSHFEDIPKNKYSLCKLISPRPCFTAKYIQCLAADIKALSHVWVVRSCLDNKLANMDEDILPTGWSIERQRFINWKISSYDRNSSKPFKNYLILLCSDNDDFIKFWRRVCTLAGGETRTINEDCDMTGGFVIVTESDCPHEVQNKAAHFDIPLVSAFWVVQCLVDGKICKFDASEKYSFTYDPE